MTYSMRRLKILPKFYNLLQERRRVVDNITLFLIFVHPTMGREGFQTIVEPLRIPWENPRSLTYHVQVKALLLRRDFEALKWKSLSPFYNINLFGLLSNMWFSGLSSYP